VNSPSSSLKKKHTPEIELLTATFAAGCFWGVQHILTQIRGVVATKVGYTGGHVKNPTYEMVCTGATGHAESVQVKYDPNEITYKELLGYFWRLHDPTQVNRQGPDIGTQYRSVIFYHSDDQRKAAEESKAEFDRSGVFKKKAATEIKPANTFYDAEEYHQDYMEKHPERACHILRPR
jgi:methionine-S-sulfoxide reductase